MLTPQAPRGPAFIEEQPFFLRVVAPKNIFPKTLPVREQVHYTALFVVTAVAFALSAVVLPPRAALAAAGAFALSSDARCGDN